MAVRPKLEPGSASPSKKPKKLDNGLDDVAMADWAAQDSMLWGKMGVDAQGTGLSDPVKTIEVGWVGLVLLEFIMAYTISSGQMAAPSRFPRRKRSRQAAFGFV